MKTFEFSITETNYGTITIEAETQEAAYDMVRQEYENDAAYWHDSDIDFEFIGEESEKE